MNTWAGGIPLTKAETRELKRLNGKHRDIRLLGAAALEKQAEKVKLQEERQAWVSANHLACFQCGTTAGEWAGGGRNKWGRLYVICVRCVRAPKQRKGPDTNTRPSSALKGRLKSVPDMPEGITGGLEREGF